MQSVVWGLGGALDAQGRRVFDRLLRRLASGGGPGEDLDYRPPGHDQEENR